MMTTKTFSRISLALLLALLVPPTGAWAHTVWVDPPPRTNGQASGSAGNYSGNETAPCGSLTLYPVSAKPTVYQAGSTVTMTFEETIIHHGNFQAYFAPVTVTNQANVLPAGIPSPVPSPSPIIALPQVSLNNGVVPYIHKVQVKIPNEPCDHCTLQMIQVNTDHITGTPVYPTPGTQGIVYYQTCADVQIIASPVPSPSVTPTPTPTVTSTPTPTPTTTTSCGTPPPAPIPATFANVNSTILQPMCISCHTGSNITNGDTDLSTYAGVFGTVNLAMPANSLIYQLTMEGPNNGGMPQTGTALTPAQEDLILRWIEAGAPNN